MWTKDWNSSCQLTPIRRQEDYRSSLHQKRKITSMLKEEVEIFVVIVYTRQMMSFGLATTTSVSKAKEKVEAKFCLVCRKLALYHI